MKPIDFWYIRSIPNNPHFRRVTYGDGLFVVVGYDSIYTSPDGIAWQNRYSSSTEPVRAAVYTGSRFVAISENSYFDQVMCINLYALLSYDGETWTRGNETRTPHGLYYTSGVAANGGLLVAAGDGLQTSFDEGVNWQETFYNPMMRFYDICKGSTPDGDRFVAVGTEVYIGLESSAMMSAASSDGQNWTTNNLGWNSDNTYFGSIAYGNGRFIAVGNNSRFYSSTDGIHWSRLSFVANEDVYQITFGFDTFVAVGKSGYVYDSSDGVHWSSRQVCGEDLIDVHAGANTFIAVAYQGNVYQSESFDPNDHLLVLEFSGNGQVEVRDASGQCVNNAEGNWSRSFHQGEQVTLQASGISREIVIRLTDPFGHVFSLPTGRWEMTKFDRWIGAISSLDSTLHITMDKDMTLMARFVRFTPDPPHPGGPRAIEAAE